MPNSALYKPSFANLSRPTLVRTTILEVSFSYSDPPSRVKQVLTNLARETPRVLPTPAPVVRIVKYGDFAICYEIYLSVSQQAETAVVRDGFMTRVWYAVQRHGLTIPYPIATEIAAQAKDFQFDPLHEARTVLQSHARFADSVDTRTD